MTSIAVWLLIAVSNGWHNQGTVTTIAQTPTAEACADLKANIKKQTPRNLANFMCVAATVVSIEERK